VVRTVESYSTCRGFKSHLRSFYVKETVLLLSLVHLDKVVVNREGLVNVLLLYLFLMICED
jgi:hypothetical protein